MWKTDRGVDCIKVQNLQRLLMGSTKAESLKGIGTVLAD